MKSKLKVTDDIQVELYPCNPNRYKWQRLKVGDISAMEGFCEEYSDVRHMIVETANSGTYEFWVNKKDLAKKKK